MGDVTCGMELRTPSDMIYLRPVRAFVRELAENIGFNHERASDIELALDEVFANAIEHGSADAKSPVVIRCLPTDRMMKITVSDTGSGNASNRKLASAWTNAVKEKTKSQTERGHGLLLAHNLTDEISMEPNPTGGIDVHMVIYKEGQQIEQK